MMDDEAFGEEPSKRVPPLNQCYRVAMSLLWLMLVVVAALLLCFRLLMLLLLVVLLSLLVGVSLSLFANVIAIVFC